MSLEILVDMNLSPGWVPHFQQQGWAAVHWSQIGAYSADDATIMIWARQNQHIVFTHDLDFGACLALTGAGGPSVFQVRTLDVLPDRIGAVVVSVIQQHENELRLGALIVLDRARVRVRLLPLPRP
jgi:predicted nuclease of predicted toxin-antitoxin system